MLVRDADVSPVPCLLSPSDTVERAWRLFREHQAEILPVASEGEMLLGVLDRKMILELDPGDILSGCTVDAVMEKAPASVREDCGLEDVWELPGSVLPVVDAGGRVTGVLRKCDAGYAYYQKATDMWKQVEAILDAAHNGIIAIDRQGMVTIFNEAAEKITRRKKEQAMGKHLSEVIIPLGLLDILRSGEGQLSHKFTVNYSSGTRVYVTNRTPIIQNGELVGAVGVFQDISELESISEELHSVKQLNQELQAVIESQYDGVIVTDIDGVVLRVNHAHERITGIPAGEMQGKSMRELVEKGYYSKSVVDAVLRQGKAVTLMERSQNGVKNTNLLLVTGSPARDALGRIVRVVITVRDLTELNELKRQLEETKELSKRYRSELVELRGRLMDQDNLIFNSPKVQELLAMALRVAQVDSTVLILGESGVGKEVFAKVIHTHSPRKKGPFIKVNCGAIPANLLETELFGYEAGAFTGASREGKMGMFELAHNGTLFLDEIGDLPLPLQVKILRSIQDREIQRVGGRKPLPVNVRILAATNRNLEEMVQQGEFREDLYFRLNVVPLYIPPLRHRREEIIPLVYSFRDKFSQAYNIKKDFAPEVFELFLNYDWPGNVRELENIVERLMVTTPGPVVTPEQVPDHLLPQRPRSVPKVIVQGILPLKQAMIEMERQLLQHALREFGSTYKAAEVLEVNQSTVVRKLKRIGNYD